MIGSVGLKKHVQHWSLRPSLPFTISPAWRTTMLVTHADPESKAGSLLGKEAQRRRLLAIALDARATKCCARSMDEDSVMASAGGIQAGEIRVIALGEAYGSAGALKIGEAEKSISEAIDDCSMGVLIDFRKTTYIGCGFLTILLRAFERARRSNRRLFLCTASKGPAKVFAATRLDALYLVFTSCRDAIGFMAIQRNDDS